VVFLSSSCRETAKNAIKKNDGTKCRGKKYYFSTFLEKVFDMVFFQKVFNGVFKNPLVEKRTKNAIKKSRKYCFSETKYLPTSFSGYLPDIRRFQKSFGAP
jgi:hypothetical protein